ncbi:MAG: methylamine utilization protein [Caulobacter sp. 12-67-6]|nr:MAG: methylamine utilization protein [Caulobacter sp. 12-67-6]OYX71747.1 MAG: methylamine utilization protein [Caulobacter sp. 32-67-35]
MKFATALLLVAIMGGDALAGSLTVTVRGANGKPVSDAVVTVHPGGQPSRGPIKFPWPYRVQQQNIQFSPFVLIVPAGAEVAFPNLDKVRHHVYSFSPGNKFELKLYGREENRIVKLPTAGAAAIGCNIHDQMVGFIKVVDTAYAAKSDASGVATIADAPSGPVVVRVWHPYLRGPKNEKVLPVTSLGGGATREAVTIELRAPAAHH